MYSIYYNLIIVKENYAYMCEAIQLGGGKLFTLSYLHCMIGGLIDVNIPENIFFPIHRCNQ